ncbi:MAG: SRPBCC family protein [Saprospiraceae bacterium]|nr:SRPBCC family protein [Saprospiraceae bacterium]
MTTYHFITQWQFRAPVERVWDEIYHSERWPSWWKGVLAVETLVDGNPNSIGDAKRYTWRSRLPYKLRFDMTLAEKVPFQRLVGRASGELEGTGTWTFEEKDGITHVRYDWQVRTTKRWMNLLTPIARPFFEWNHDVVMEWGRKGLEAMFIDD